MVSLLQDKKSFSMASIKVVLSDFLLVCSSIISRFLLKKSAIINLSILDLSFPNNY